MAGNLGLAGTATYGLVGPGGRIINAIRSDPIIIARLWREEYVELPEGVGIGWVYDRETGSFTQPEG